MSAALVAPAVAQFWNPFGSPPPQRRAPQQQAPSFNPFGGWFGGGGPPPAHERVQRPRPVDSSSAPPPARRPADAATVTSPILVLGDSMADWLAYGLEDALSEKPDFGIVRRHRASSGLVRYDPRRDVEWPQAAREAITAERPKFIVMMVGFHDRQPIRDRVAAPKGPAPKGAAPARPAETAEYDDPDSPEARARASAEQQNAEMRKAEQDKLERDKLEREKAELYPEGAPDPALPPERPRPSASGPMEFQTEAWEAAYIQRIDATIAALKSAGVPVFWVGLPPQRNARMAADAVYLNELYRARAERAGIVFVDIWDGFVDEAGRYIVQGPDLEGQTRRLRSGDGIYFTRAGARKLAHYVEREILRSLTTRDTPIALPVPEPAVPTPVKPGTTVRPVAGPVIPLTAAFGGGTELLGSGRRSSTGIDATASRVLIKGEPITAPVGRADNFAWPRGGTATIEEPEPEPGSTVALPHEPVQHPPAVEPAPPAQRPQQTQPPAAAKAAPRARPQNNGEAKQPPPRRAPPSPPRANNDGPRPPLGIPFFR